MSRQPAYKVMSYRATSLGVWCSMWSKGRISLTSSRSRVALEPTQPLFQ